MLKDPAKVRDSWNAVYRGATNAHKIAVLEEGMKYQQIGIPPEEAQPGNRDLKGEAVCTV